MRVPASAKRDTNLVWMWVGLALAAVLVVIAYVTLDQSDRLSSERRMEKELREQERNRARERR